jgi:hypothetical protein
MSGEGFDVHDQSGVIYPFALLEWLLSVYAKAILAGPIYFPHRTSFLMLISSVREVTSSDLIVYFRMVSMVRRTYTIV